MPATRLSRDAYTVGWITILPVEFGAARAMFDEEHACPTTPSGDPYRYAVGNINGHNVVITCSGEAGTAPANHCATQMKRTFTNIKIGLLSGIGGGVPSPKHDIRLGDVVVSKPGPGHSGVACYDAGKLVDDGFESTGHLDRPPPVLRNAVTWLETNLGLGDSQFCNYLANVKPADLVSIDGLSDELYEAGDITKQIRRQPRPGGSQPYIHHGLIASGSWVIKTSGSKRDDLLRRVKGEVLCFEMEAAGLMNTFPCLVVRGISDYCDSHKNDGWHNYASTTAACYCKWLLKSIAVEGTERNASLAASIANEENEGLRSSNEQEPSASRVSSKMPEDQRTFEHDRMGCDSDPTMATSESELYDCIQQMQYTPAEDELEHIRSRKGTIVNESCSWISSEVDAFIGSSSPVLWIHGDPGKGKTMMSIYVIQHLRDAYGPESVYFFFCQHDSGEHRTAGAVLKSLICQILLNSALGKQRRLIVGRHLLENFRVQGARLLSSRASEGSLKRILHNILAELDNAFIVVDGLDECEVNSVSSLIEHMLPMTLNTSIKYILTSRNQPKILHQSLRGFTEVHLEQAHYDTLVRSGVRAFISAKFHDLKIKNDQNNSFRSKTKKQKPCFDLRSIETRMSQQADDSFIWAAMIHDQIRNEGVDYAWELFEDCPVNLGALYKRIVRRVLMLDPNALASSGRNKRLDTLRVKFCRRILRTLCVAPRSLTKLEMQEAIEFPNSTANFSFEGILDDCGGLIVVRAEKIHLIHLSLKNYMLEQECQIDFDTKVQDGHAELASSCMAFFEKIAATKADVSNPKYLKILTSLKLGHYKDDDVFLEYATSHFMFHATEALKFADVSESMTRSLNKFFNAAGGCLYYLLNEENIPGLTVYHLKNDQFRLNQRQLLIVAAQFGLCQFLEAEDLEYLEDLEFVDLLVEIAATHDHCNIVSAIVERLKLYSLDIYGLEQAEKVKNRLRKLAEDISLVRGSVDTFKYAWSRQAGYLQSLIKAVLYGHTDIVKFILSCNLPGSYEDFHLASIWFGPHDILEHRSLEYQSGFHLLTHHSIGPDLIPDHCREYMGDYIGLLRFTMDNISKCQVISSTLLPYHPRDDQWRPWDPELQLKEALVTSSTVALCLRGTGRVYRKIDGFNDIPGSDLSFQEIVTNSVLKDAIPLNPTSFIGSQVHCRIFWNIGNLLDIAIHKIRPQIIKTLLESGFQVGLKKNQVMDISLQRGWGQVLGHLIKSAFQNVDTDLVLGRGLYQALYWGRSECVDVILALGGNGDMPIFLNPTGNDQDGPKFDISKAGEETTVMCQLAQEDNYIALQYLLDKSPVVRSMSYFNKAFIQGMSHLKGINPISNVRSTAESVRMCFYSLSDRFGALPLGWQQHKTERGWAYFSHETDSGSYTTWQDPRIPYQIGESLDDFWSDQAAPKYDPDLERYLEERYGLESNSPISSIDDVFSDGSDSSSA